MLITNQIPTQEHQKPHRCAFVLHGLNTNPKKMTDLAQLAIQSGFKTQTGILSGHQPETENKDELQSKVSAAIWQNEFKQQWQDAISDCMEKSSERLFIGYSLGALTGMRIFDGEEGISLPSKMILISPALSLRKITYLIRGISWLPFGYLPSLNHPDYRARNAISLKNYQALFQIHDEWQKKSWTRTGSIRTLLTLAPKDELVDSQQLKDILMQRNLTQWSIKWVSNEKSTLKPNYYHLIIDSVSQGMEQWKDFEGTAKSFLNTETETK